jgi:hypothetical protein
LEDFVDILLWHGAFFPLTSFRGIEREAVRDYLNAEMVRRPYLFRVYYAKHLYVNGNLLYGGFYFLSTFSLMETFMVVLFYSPRIFLRIIWVWPL